MNGQAATTDVIVCAKDLSIHRGVGGAANDIRSQFSASFHHNFAAHHHAGLCPQSCTARCSRNLTRMFQRKAMERCRQK